MFVFNFQKRIPEVFLRKVVLKICIKFTGKHPCRRVISVKLLCIFIEITLRHGFFPDNLLHIFSTPFLKNTFALLLLYFENKAFYNSVYLSVIVCHFYHNVFFFLYNQTIIVEQA